MTMTGQPNRMLAPMKYIKADRCILRRSDAAPGWLHAMREPTLTFSISGGVWLLNIAAGGAFY
jgi:hypothetical protein